MATFTYRARDEQGKLVSGAMDAVSADELTAKLHKMGFMATAVNAVKPGIRISEAMAGCRPIKMQDVLVFYFQLANLIESAIPILTALKAIETQTENQKLRKIIGEVQRSIESGGLLSAGLSRHPRVFTKLFVSMIKAGEESGKLAQVLRRYAVYAESQAELREKVKGALFYPAILFTASIAVVLFIVTFIIPQFAQLFTKAGIKLPFVTRALFVAGLFIKRYWLLLVLGFAALLFWARIYRLSRSGRARVDRLILKAPVIGVLARKIFISRFTRTLATLISSGVAILQSLDITREVIGNSVISEAIFKVRQSVEQGQKMSEPLKVSGEFPADTFEMIAVGEETGNLDEMLNKIADFYDMAVGYTIKKLTTLIEPFFLAVIGSIVAFIMASMLIPIFDMVKILRH